MDILSLPRFTEKIDKSGDCWIWTSALDSHGYGQFHVSGVGSRLVHRLVMGEPDGMHVLHHCDNTKCCNPEHLYIGTHQENMRDKRNRNRVRSTSGESNPNASISETTAIRIIDLLGQKTNHRNIANITGASITTVKSISSGRTWKHLTRKTPSMTQ